MTVAGEPWGAWDYPYRKRPESVLEFCENMIACLERAPADERDQYWRYAMDGMLSKRDELRAKFQCAPSPPKQLELLGR